MNSEDDFRLPKLSGYWVNLYLVLGLGLYFLSYLLTRVSRIKDFLGL